MLTPTRQSVHSVRAGVLNVWGVRSRSGLLLLGDGWEGLPEGGCS